MLETLATILLYLILGYVGLILLVAICSTGPVWVAELFRRK